MCNSLCLAIDDTLAQADKNSETFHLWSNFAATIQRRCKHHSAFAPLKFGGFREKSHLFGGFIKHNTILEAITFTPAQVHVFNMVSHIKSALALEQLREQLSAFYAKQIDDEMDSLWESGQWNEKKLQELRGSHFRTPYNK